MIRAGGSRPSARNAASMRCAIGVRSAPRRSRAGRRGREIDGASRAASGCPARTKIALRVSNSSSALEVRRHLDLARRRADHEVELAARAGRRRGPGRSASSTVTSTFGIVDHEAQQRVGEHVVREERADADAQVAVGRIGHALHLGTVARRASPTIVMRARQQLWPKGLSSAPWRPRTKSWHPEVLFEPERLALSACCERCSSRAARCRLPWRATLMKWRSWRAPRRDPPGEGGGGGSRRARLSRPRR